MKGLIVVMVALCYLLSLNACYWDNPPEPIPIDPEMVSFETHIIPIFNESCNTAGCHDDTHAPDLRPDVAWQSLVSGGYVNTTFPEQSEIYTSVANGGMPPTGSLSQLEIELILGWIKKGARND
jgi:hypothetical protein